MKRLRILTALILALSLTAGLCGCAGGDPAKKLARAQEKLSQVSSMSYEMEMDMEVSAMGQKLSLDTTCVADCVVEPLAMKMEMSTRLNGLGIDGDDLGSIDYTVYAVQDGDSFTAYTKMFGTWMKETLDGLDELEQYDARLSMDTYLSSFASVTEGESEEINGSKATRFDCVVSSEGMDEIIGASGAYSQLSQLGIDEDVAGDLMTGLGEMTYSIWVDDRSGLPVRCEMDMSEIMGQLMDKIFDAVGEDADSVSMDRLTVVMTMTGFDSVEPVEVPAEALDAVEMEGFSLFS